MTATESTSAKLRRVEQERDHWAVRADRAEKERDEALAKLAKPCGECHPCEQSAPLQVAQKIADTNDLLRAELASARTELDAVRTARDNLDRQLAAAHKEIEQLDDDLNLCPRCGIAIDADITGDTPALASWMVARDGGRSCVRCDQEIRRGEAYELLPDVDELRHIHCRDPEESSDG